MRGHDAIGGRISFAKGAHKHASRTHRCRLCGKISRGNGGHSAHGKACYKRHGVEWFGDYDRGYLTPAQHSALRRIEDAKCDELKARGLYVGVAQPEKDAS